MIYLKESIGKEYRNVSTIQAVDEPKKTYNVEGYATTFKPYELYEFDGIKYYEMIDRHALDGADMSDVIMQYDHEGRVMARQSNGTLTITTDTYGLHVKANLSKSNASRELHEDIASGLITKMSWAFTVAEDSYDKNTRTRIIKRINKVYDVSAVSIPANDQTSINVKSQSKENKGVNERKKQRLRLRIKLLEMECM